VLVAQIALDQFPPGPKGQQTHGPHPHDLLVHLVDEEGVLGQVHGQLHIDDVLGNDLEVGSRSLLAFLMDPLRTQAIEVDEYVQGGGGHMFPQLVIGLQEVQGIQLGVGLQQPKSHVLYTGNLVQRLMLEDRQLETVPEEQDQQLERQQELELRHPKG